MIEEVKLNSFTSFKILTSLKKNEVLKYYSNSVCVLIMGNDIVEKGDRVLVGLVNDKIHIVKPAETLDSIAAYYGIEKQKILDKNNVKTLFVGQQLFI